MYVALETEGTAAFQCAFEALASPKQALERVLLQEVADSPPSQIRARGVRWSELLVPLGSRRHP